MLKPVCRCNVARRTRPRPATTLVEVLGTLSVLLVLGVSAASILGSITQVGARRSQASISRASVERLAKIFRQDVHQASDIQVSHSPLSLDLSTDDGAIRYEWIEKVGSLRRQVSNGETPLSIESFALPGDLQPGISLTDDLVALRITEDQASSGPLNRPWVIEAIR